MSIFKMCIRSEYMYTIGGSINKSKIVCDVHT